MKLLNLLSAFLFFILFGGDIANAQSNLLSKIDTNIVLNYNGEPLRYHQYMAMLKTGDYYIITNLGSGFEKPVKELIKYSAAQKRNMKMDQASIDKNIAGMFGIHEALPLSKVDTTIVVYNTDGKPLHYYQYAPLVLHKGFTILNDKGKRYLRSQREFMLKVAGGVDSTYFKTFLLHETDSVSLNNMLYYALNKMDKIRVEKSKRRMYLERNGKVIYEFPINLGRNPVGAKQKEGDGRTPEGSYAIDFNINSKAAYYKGFHISYPNEQDALKAKKLGVSPGKDIMIHGTSEQRSKLKDWTNGCIAVSNAHIDSLAKYYYNGIPIQINK